LTSSCRVDPEIPSHTQHTGSAGWLPGRNFLSRYLQKSKYSEPRQKIATVIHRIATSHNNSYDLAYFFIGMNVLIRQAHNFIMCKGIKPSSHCLYLPSLPTPRTFYAVASHSLLVPRNFMPFPAPTAANISSYLVISAAKTYRTFRLDKNTSR
jgi:hypothetical protein